MNQFKTILLIIAIAWAFFASMLVREESIRYDRLKSQVKKNDSIREVTDSILYVYDTLTHIDTIFKTITHEKTIFYDSIRYLDVERKDSFVTNYLRQFGSRKVD